MKLLELNELIDIYRSLRIELRIHQTLNKQLNMKILRDGNPVTQWNMTLELMGVGGELNG